MIAMIVTGYLVKAGFEVECRSTVASVMSRPAVDADCALLDILLPDGSGYDVCAHIRAQCNCPIIFASALDDASSIVKALEMGGDDYIAKPFDAAVLVARIKANLRRASSFTRDVSIVDSYMGSSFTLDTTSHEVVGARGAVRLTAIEEQLLLALMRNPGRFRTPEELYLGVWGKDSYGDVHTVIVHLSNLRKKIASAGGDPSCLAHERGRGYAFAAGSPGVSAESEATHVASAQ